MQPLPATVLIDRFASAANHFEDAARDLGAPNVHETIMTAARELHGGVGSLQMLAPRDVKAVVIPKIDDAAKGAVALAGQLKAGPAKEPAATVQALQGYAQVAYEAAGAVDTGLDRYSPMDRFSQGW